MPENDPMSAPHLLGDSWANERWFDSEAERDRAVEGILRQPPYYRKGDSPSIIVEKIERPNSAS